jgi:L-alanine-DL-glutamate epimerase-like enolase superfamily enzyme
LIAAMKITDLEIRCCHYEVPAISAEKFRDGSVIDGLDFLVLTITTESGLRASMFGFAGRSALGSGHLAAASLRPLLIGRNALDREEIWKAFRTANRWWHHLPIYSYGPVDICLWLLGAQAAAQPLWRYLGGARRQIPVYCSSLVLPDAEAYANEALAVKNAGFKAYKTHPPGTSLKQDIEIHQAVRDAVGDEFDLMADPVAPYTLEEAIRFGRVLESLNFKWLEEPLPDESFSALRELTRVLDIPIVGTEVLANHPYSVAECISTRVVDVVRADVSWTGGVTGTMKTAHLAEAFHMNCEIHSSIFHPLELVNLHVNAAITNSTYFELLYPIANFDFGLVSPLPICNGIATLPEEPGLGIELDWDMIENATIAQL